MQVPNTGLEAASLWSVAENQQHTHSMESISESCVDRH